MARPVMRLRTLVLSGGAPSPVRGPRPGRRCGPVARDDWLRRGTADGIRATGRPSAGSTAAGRRSVPESGPYATRRAAAGSRNATAVATGTGRPVAAASCCAPAPPDRFLPPVPPRAAAVGGQGADRRHPGGLRSRRPDAGDGRHRDHEEPGQPALRGDWRMGGCRPDGADRGEMALRRGNGSAGALPLPPRLMDRRDLSQGTQGRARRRRARINSAFAGGLFAPAAMVTAADSRHDCATGPSPMAGGRAQGPGHGDRRVLSEAVQGRARGFRGATGATVPIHPCAISCAVSSAAQSW